jgi:hypothetical protein
MAETKAHHVDEHNKRVSFGAEEQVRMIVYDDSPVENNVIHHATKRNTSFTSSDAPPSKVTVTTALSDVPRPISPPAQLDDIRPLVAISPPLPSLVKRMENENENPFRPEETLYHEVDPIVEAYRQRPFPPSPTGSPVPPAISSSPSPVITNGGRHIAQNNVSTSEDRRRSTGTPTHKKTPASATEDLTDTPRRSTADKCVSGATADQHLLGDLPPPGVVEEVYIKKKKRFGCCSLQ